MKRETHPPQKKEKERKKQLQASKIVKHLEGLTEAESLD